MVAILRAVTYLCPTVPVEFFQTALELLEEATGTHATLQYEWRAPGPAASHWSDPSLSFLIQNSFDIAFMPAAGYIQLTRTAQTESSVKMELLPVSPCFQHPSNKDADNGTYIDLIVHADKPEHNVHQLLDLRGCHWACTAEGTLAHTVMQDALLKIGENLTFFGSTHYSASHLSSANMVLTKQVEAAAIDAAALTCNRRYLHNGAEDIVVLSSWGPMAPYAIVVNANLPGELKTKLVKAFLKMNSTDARLEKFGLIKFASNDDSRYDAERMLLDDVKSKKSQVLYY